MNRNSKEQQATWGYRGVVGRVRIEKVNTTMSEERMVRKEKNASRVFWLALSIPCR